MQPALAADSRNVVSAKAARPSGAGSATGEITVVVVERSSATLMVTPSGGAWGGPASGGEPPAGPGGAGPRGPPAHPPPAPPAPPPPAPGGRRARGARARPGLLRGE